MKRFFLTLSAGVLAVALALAATEYVVARPGTRFANLPYVPATAPDYDAQRHRLDVYAPNERLPAGDRKSTRLNSSHPSISRMPSSA